MQNTDWAYGTAIAIYLLTQPHCGAVNSTMLLSPERFGDFKGEITLTVTGNPIKGCYLFEFKGSEGGAVDIEVDRNDIRYRSGTYSGITSCLLASFLGRFGLSFDDPQTSVYRRTGTVCVTNQAVMNAIEATISQAVFKVTVGHGFISTENGEYVTARYTRGIVAGKPVKFPVTRDK